MLVDLEELTEAEQPVRRSRVCIIGAGVAGLTLATRLAELGLEVHLLEGGGRTDEDRSQSLYNARMAAWRHTGTTEGRFRLYGGSSTRWGAQLLSFTDDVFHPPAGTPSESWPLDNTDLRRYFSDVEDLMQADHLPFDGDDFYNAMRVTDRPPAELLGSKSKQDLRLRFSKWAPFAARNLAQTLGVRAEESDRITLFLHANVTEILLTPDGKRAEAVLVRNFQGIHFRFEADEIVVAAGTIESSRLLLLSRSVQREGIGNRYGQVGAGFQDHISLPLCTLRGRTRSRMLHWFAPFMVNGTAHSAKLEASDELRSRAGLPSVMAHIILEEPDGSGADVVRDLMRSIQRGDRLVALRRALPRLPGAAIGIVRMAWILKLKGRRTVSDDAVVTLCIDSEQPLNTNRIALAPKEVDSLGMPRAVVKWSVTDVELQDLLRYAGIVMSRMKAAGLAELDCASAVTDAIGQLAKENQVKPETLQRVRNLVRDTFHPMGGTPMGDNPATSVVDPELRVHGVENLSIASASTFPGGGSSNPTFTLMALTLRLADRLAASESASMRAERLQPVSALL
jgi:choline dehydrogenase-like flavoprotein